MFIEERHDKILNLLYDNGRVEVSMLTELFNVSVDSIRRDLRILEEKGLIKKTYGGAILADKTSTTLPLRERHDTNQSGKEAIAKYAATFINDDDTIYLENSSTVSRIVPHLKRKKNLTIFTNCLMICNLIINHKINCNLHMVGGKVDLEMENTYGVYALEFIEQLYVDKVFTGICSIHSSWGLSTPNAWEAPLIKAIIKAGKEVFILGDESKFQKKSTVQICELKNDFTIIADIKKDSPLLDTFKVLIEKGLHIISVEK